MKKIIPIEELPAWRRTIRDAGKRLVVTNGVFDLMHRGHAEYLAQAASLGDILLVLVNDDASVTALKGPTRPLNPQDDRAAMLASLECVGAVSIFRGPKAADALRAAAPDVYVKGGDYTPETLDRDEFSALQACGSAIRILPLVPGCSTTGIVQRILAEKRSGEAEGVSALNQKLMPLFRRRSIRTFLPREITQEEIGLLLEAAMAAPSAKACYPAEFIVMTDPSLRKKVAEHLPNGPFLEKAPAGFLVCGNLERSCSGELSYLLQDCSACIENLLLAASILGLGACWLGIHPRPERIQAIKELFSLPESIVPIAAIALGWSTETKPPRTNYNPEQVHLNQW